MLIIGLKFHNLKQQKTQRLFWIGFLVLSLSFFSSCEKDESSSITAVQPISQKPLGKILPLGASRVKGDRPNYESYRYELWKLLVDENYDFDFIGTVKDPGNYPDYAGLFFDKDHEGHGGWKTSDILDNLTLILEETGVPDIVLLSSPGGNDALLGVDYNEILANINSIIDTLQGINPEVIIIIEKQAPARSTAMTPELNQLFNSLLAGVHNIALYQSNSFSNVITVDLATGFNDSLIQDNIHYNQAGAKFVANRYFEVIEGLP